MSEHDRQGEHKPMPFKRVIKKLLDTPPDPRTSSSKGKKKVERPGNEPGAHG